MKRRKKKITLQGSLLDNIERKRRFAKYMRSYRKEKKANDPKWYNRLKLYKKIADKRHRKKLKMDVLSYYSQKEIRCVHCGIKNVNILTIDHIEGGGLKHLKTIGGSGARFYRWLRKNNYPVGFQVLCHNCQWIKRRDNNENRQRENSTTPIRKLDTMKRRYEKIKTNVFLHYSPQFKCVKCGFSDEKALCIDHINNDGAKHRKRLGRKNIYSWIIKNNYPVYLQVLCMNCNWEKGSGVIIG